MRVGYGLGLEQQQKLIMTPELRQAITVLQYSAVELAEYIQQELTENPLLEIKEEQSEKGLDESLDSNKGTEEKDNIDWQEYFEDKSDLGIYDQKEKKKEEYRFENRITKLPTLEEHLLEQLGVLRINKVQKRIGEFIIGSLNEYGYLQVELPKIAQELSVTVEEAKGVLELIQSFDPPGVGARNLTECLLIQAKSLGVDNLLIKNIITNHLEQLSNGRILKVANDLGVSAKEIQKALDIIKTLDPKPGRNFSNENDIRYIVPDIIVERVEKEYIVIVNDTYMPRLGINQGYREVLNSKNLRDEEAVKYVEGKLNWASWLLKSIEQRRITLYKVANAIINHQRAFFDRGLNYLRPLTLKQVAEEIGVHESTVSRATANKYMQTPRGVFEMKFFFASGLDTFDGEMASAQSIKKQLKEVIDGESKEKPLSDQKIADILQQKGINISRRTVAKYRDELGILSTSQRKRY